MKQLGQDLTSGLSNFLSGDLVKFSRGRSISRERFLARADPTPPQTLQDPAQSHHDPTVAWGVAGDDLAGIARKRSLS